VASLGRKPHWAGPFELRPVFNYSYDGRDALD
jgi:hypothetical protein